jgi:Rrf2 family nitric oxide-sensitive transcriptional repressor
MYMSAKQGSNCTTDEIAAYYRISSAHLGRVIRRLQGYGYVKAIRGRKGGVRLARDPMAFTVGEVVETLEQGAEPLDQAKGPHFDNPETGDRMHAAMRRAHGLFLNYLAKITFGDLAVDGLPPAPPIQQQPASPPQREETPVPVGAGFGSSPERHQGPGLGTNPFGMP